MVTVKTLVGTEGDMTLDAALAEMGLHREDAVDYSALYDVLDEALVLPSPIVSELTRMENRLIALFPHMTLAAVEDMAENIVFFNLSFS